MVVVTSEDVVIDQNGGLYKIIERLRDDVFEDNDPRYKLNHKVTKITYTDDGVTVTTAGGMTYTADYAIVTFSLGVLQNEVVTFDPPLPNWKRYSIMGATFVTDSPVYAQFTGTFWDNSEFIMYGSERKGAITRSGRTLTSSYQGAGFYKHNLAAQRHGGSRS